MQGAGALLGAAAGEAAPRSSTNDRRGEDPSLRLRTLAVAARHLVLNGELRRDAWPEANAGALAAPRDGHPVNALLSAAAIPLAIKYRRQAATLVKAVEEMGAIQQAGAESLTAAVAVGAAVAAYAHGQRHMDVWLAVLETVEMSDRARNSELMRMMQDGWARFDEEGHVSLLSVAPIRAVLHTAKLSMHDDPAQAVGAVRDAAISSAQFGFFVGALMGARFRDPHWTWPIPAAAWYREAGRLLLGEASGAVSLQPDFPWQVAPS